MGTLRRVKYAVIAWWLRRRGRTDLTNYCDERGYREAVGGRWGLWEVDGPFGTMHLWLRSPCAHYPAPISATHTEPLAIEEYIEEGAEV